MSEIVSSPLIFSQQEVKDRFQLHQFIHKLFSPCRAGKGDLIGIPAEEIFHIYRIQYPMTVLTTAIVSNMLLTGGFVDEEDPEMSVFYGKLHEEYFLALKKEAKMCLLEYIKEPLNIRYRQLVLGIRVRQSINSTIKLDQNFIISKFVENWTLNPANAYNYMHGFTPDYRCSAVELYNYYRIICFIYRLTCVDKVTFNESLENMGFKSRKGRVHCKAGIRYYPELYIPLSMEDKVLSVEMNMCCIFNGHTHWTNKGILENFIEVQREDICAENLERMGLNEQERKTVEEEKAKLDIRRTFETGEIPLGKTTKTPKTQDNMGHNERPESESEETKTEALQIESEDSNERTSCFKGTTDRPAADECPSEDPIDFDEPLDIGETFRDRYTKGTGIESADESVVGSESDDEGDGGDIVESDGPSIEQIASALTVPYKMTPEGAFTPDVMRNWLQTMNIPEQDQVMEMYDSIMEILRN